MKKGGAITGEKCQMLNKRFDLTKVLSGAQVKLRSEIKVFFFFFNRKQKCKNVNMV